MGWDFWLDWFLVVYLKVNSIGSDSLFLFDGLECRPWALIGLWKAAFFQFSLCPLHLLYRAVICCFFPELAGLLGLLVPIGSPRVGASLLYRKPGPLGTVLFKGGKGTQKLGWLWISALQVRQRSCIHWEAWKVPMKQQQNEWACLSDACDVAEVTRACRLVFSLQSNF